MTRPRWITAADRPDAFPPVEQALDEPNGLLAIGGDLSAERLLAAYARGIFPWYEEGQPILWWSPEPRAILWPEELHVARRLQRDIRGTDLRLTADRAFEKVIEHCAQPRRYAAETWITAAMGAAYEELHGLGWAHSFEAWESQRLVGGLYGVAIGRVFFGESMFSNVSNASKIAFVAAVDFLRARGFELIDCQIWSSHLESLGASTLPREEFVQRLEELCVPQGSPDSWERDFESFREGSA